MTTSLSPDFAYIPLPTPAGAWPPSPPGATIARIADHVAIAQGQLAEQFRNSPNLQALVGILAGRFQGIEDALYSIYAGRPFPVAQGDALSRWGKAVGEPRPTSGPTATSDTAYYGLLRAQIAENTGEGTPEVGLGLLRDLGALAVQYYEPGFYGVQIAFVGRLSVSNAQLAGMLTVASPPVSYSVVQQADANSFAFDSSVVGWDDGELGDVVI